MSSAVEALRSIAADLERRGEPWALVGGFAVSARAEPRFTRDVDVAVAVADDRAAEQTVRWLIEQGYRPLATVEQNLRSSKTPSASRSFPRSWSRSPGLDI